MKTRSSKKNKVEFDFAQEMEFLLYGISSHLDDYSISWSINQMLNLKLSKTNNVVIENPRNKIQTEFACFSYEDEEDYKDYVLLQNKSGINKILRELNEVDYFFKVSGFLPSEIDEYLLSRLKKINGINLAYRINHKLLSKTNQTKFLSIFTTINS